MKSGRIVNAVVLSAFAAGWGCATTRPPTAQLQQARKAYQVAECGPAKDLNPADLHDARILLNRAEKAAQDGPTSAEAIHRACCSSSLCPIDITSR